MNPEQERLNDDEPWRRWGPYLSERQWGTVREDYSADGDAWNYLPHDAARSRAYRWGEDGLAGFSDDRQRLCIALALWNTRDHILKERLFGLTNAEGNHGEDVKELYYYLDATPTHSYLKMLYKYPQAAFPYQRLVEENARRGRHEPEFELIDTGLFDEDRYFDVFVEYAKAGPDDILMRVTVHNRSPEAARLHVIPQVWFRNQWSFHPHTSRPRIDVVSDSQVSLDHVDLGKLTLHVEGGPELLFCDNDTNGRRLFHETDEAGYFKDAFHEYLVDGLAEAINPARVGTKVGVHHDITVPAQGSSIVRLRLAKPVAVDAFADFDAVFAQRIAEADLFYGEIQKDLADADARNIQRQAFAGMIWSKQYYGYDIRLWLEGDPGQPAPPPQRLKGRNRNWLHLNNADIISMPDKWEYPWYASWDLAFHCIPFALIDAEFAKDQLVRLTKSWYMHPTGQLPAYEWSFDDANPPVHAWAALRVYQIDRKRTGTGDFAFLERVFHKLLLNFTWWVNRKDAHDRNIFQGGFLGLDNIGVFDRNKPLPNGEYLDQADGTSWMAMYCLNLMRIAIELALKYPVYQDIATKFFEHFLQIAENMTGRVAPGEKSMGLWDEEDQFYYDVLNFPDDRREPLKTRSLVGLIPLFAVEVLDRKMLDHVPDFRRRLQWLMEHRTDLCKLVSHWEVPGVGRRGLFSLLRGHRMKGLLRRMLDETEFLSDYGVRGLSRYHKDHPFAFERDGQRSEIAYEPGESTTGMFGGNSNWRGPIWMPINFLIVEALQKFHYYYGDDFKVECPTGSGKFVTILEVSQELTRRLTRLFLRDASGRRAVFGDCERFQSDPHFRDYIPFFEYFHGDTGRGVGASHQTGWTGLIAKLLQPRREEGDEDR